MADVGNALAAALESEGGTLKAFLRVLHTEQQALVRFDTDAVSALGAEKARLIERLTEFDEERNRTLTARGCGAKGTDVEAWLQSHAATGGALEQLRQHWKALLRDARAARSLMDQNQLLIEDRLTRSRRALAALKAAAQIDTVYVADGQLQQVLPNAYLAAS